MPLGETQLRALLDAADQGLALLDEQGTVCFGNAAFAQLCDSTPDAVVGCTLADLFPRLAAEIDWGHAASNAIHRGRTVQLTRLAIRGATRVDCRLGPIELEGSAPAAVLALSGHMLGLY